MKNLEDLKAVYDFWLALDHDIPVFRVVDFDKGEICIPLLEARCIVELIDFLEGISPEREIVFQDFTQFNDLIDDVFEEYLHTAAFIDGVDTISGHIYSRMRDKNISGRQMARMTGLSKTTVCNLIFGRTKYPTLYTVYSIVNGLKMLA